MSTEVDIREATSDDCEALCRLLRELDNHHAELLPDIFQPTDDEADQSDRITRFIESDSAEIFVAELQSDIIGLVSVRISENPASPMFRQQKRACIDNLFVAGEVRGQGVGNHLLDRVTEWSRARGLSYVDICVWNENKIGTTFFESAGFTPRYQRMQRRVDDTD